MSSDWEFFGTSESAARPAIALAALAEAGAGAGSCDCDRRCVGLAAARDVVLRVGVTGRGDFGNPPGSSVGLHGFVGLLIVAASG